MCPALGGCSQRATCALGNPLLYTSANIDTPCAPTRAGRLARERRRDSLAAAQRRKASASAHAASAAIARRTRHTLLHWPPVTAPPPLGSRFASQQHPGGQECAREQRPRSPRSESPCLGRQGASPRSAPFHLHPSRISVPLTLPSPTASQLTTSCESSMADDDSALGSSAEC